MHPNTRHFIIVGTRSLLAQGKAMPTKARGVDVLLSIQDILKGAQVFEHVKLFTTLKASKPNKFAEKDDADGFVVLRGHAGASASGDDQVIAVLDHVVGESVSSDCCVVKPGLGMVDLCSQ